MINLELYFGITILPKIIAIPIAILKSAFLFAPILYFCCGLIVIDYYINDFDDDVVCKHMMIILAIFIVGVLM